MNNEEQFVITVRFPEWGYGNKKTYPGFGVKYLIKTPLIYPVLDEDDNPVDENWDFEGEVIGYFKEQYKLVMGKDFVGEILFIEPCNYVFLSASKEQTNENR